MHNGVYMVMHTVLNKDAEIKLIYFFSQWT